MSTGFIAALALWPIAAQYAPLATVQTGRFILKPAEAAITSETLTKQFARLDITARLLRPMSDGAYVYQLSNPLAANRFTHHQQVKGSSTSTLQEALNRLQRQQILSYFAKDARVVSTTVPDDRLFDKQWHLNSKTDYLAALNLVKAWDLTLGSADTVIAVIDTGVRFEHDDLTGRLLTGYDFVSGVNARRSSAKVPEYLNFVKAHDGDGRDADASDPGDGVDRELSDLMSEYDINCPIQESSWHGTAMASLIAANGNDDVGMTGVDWRARILPVRAIGRCGGRRSDLLDAIRWAAGVEDPLLPPNPTPARIINLSLGIDDECVYGDQKAINDAVAAGAMIVAAVGNLGRDLDTEPSSPSHCANVLGVTAVNSTGQRASYSSYGADADVAAPGGEGASGDNKPIIVATNDGYIEPRNGSAHRFTTGTSVASPLVSGVLSLMLSVNPELSNAELRALLVDSTRAFPASDEDTACVQATCGAGLVDAFEAVKAAAAFDSENPGKLEKLILEDEKSPITAGGGGGAVVALEWLLLLNLLSFWRSRHRTSDCRKRCGSWVFNKTV